MSEQEKALTLQFLRQFQRTTRSALEVFVDRAESTIPTSLIPTYKQLAQDAAKLLTLGYLSDDPTMRTLADMMESKKISIPLMARYLVMVGFVLPLASAQSQPSEARKVLSAIKEFHNTVEQLSTIKVSQEGLLLSESLIGDIVRRIKDAIFNVVKKIGAAIAYTLSALIRLYNAIFEKITASVKSLASKLPGGEHLLSAGLSAFTSLNVSPLITAAVTVHKALTSPIAACGARLVYALKKGTLWQDLDKMFEDIEKEVGFDEIDKEFSPQEQSTPTE
jgi:hypothetical protein